MRKLLLVLGILGVSFIFGQVSADGDIKSPEGLMVTNTTYKSITLSWREVKDVKGYVIKYNKSVSIAESLEPLAQYAYESKIIQGRTSYTITGLEPATPYYFVIVSVDQRGLESLQYSREIGNTTMSANESEMQLVVPPYDKADITRSRMDKFFDNLVTRYERRLDQAGVIKKLEKLDNQLSSLEGKFQDNHRKYILRYLRSLIEAYKYDAASM